MNWTADDILQMTRAEALELAAKTPDPRQAFNRLAAQWHPDVCGDPKAHDVFIRLMALRKEVATDRTLSDGSSRTFQTAEGKRLSVTPLSVTTVDQGEFLINRRTTASLFPAANADLAEREATISQLFRFADPRMAQEMTAFLPQMLRDIPLRDGSRILVGNRGPEEILLHDFITKDGPLPPKHAAWLCSGLLNIAAWMEYASLAHGAVGPDTVLIDPKAHSVRLVAGWCFAVQSGDRPFALPARTLDLLPRLADPGQGLDSTCDLELIRLTVTESLGGIAGVAAMPPDLAMWLRLPPAHDAVEDYASWQVALESAWGRRRFVDLPVRAADIYGHHASGFS